MTVDRFGGSAGVDGFGGVLAGGIEDIGVGRDSSRFVGEYPIDGRLPKEEKGTELGGWKGVEVMGLGNAELGNGRGGVGARSSSTDFRSC